MSIPNLPNLPTDNQYKFIALAGIVLLLSGILSLEKLYLGVCLAIIIIGVLTSIIGFYLWYTRLQKFQDKVIIDESDKYNKQKTITIHQIQFQKEFTLYQDLWKSMSKLEEIINKLYSNTIGYDSFAQERKIEIQKEMEKDLTIYWERYKEFDLIYKQNKPFYPENLYTELEEIISLSVRISLENKDIDFLTAFRKKGGLSDNTDEVMSEIMKKIKSACKIIQERIQLIEVKG
jgi:hypothetical protein